MSLTPTQVQQVAHLARLDISLEKIALYAEQMNNIFAMVDQLQQGDTAGVVPMAHPLGLEQRLRPDIVSEANQREAFQAIAPLAEQGLFLVPKVIE